MSELLYPRPRGVWSGVPIPTSHFPIWCVEYPIEESLVAMPVKLRAAPAQPPTGSDELCVTMSSFSTFTCSGLRPVCSAQRDGLQYLKM